MLGFIIFYDGIGPKRLTSRCCLCFAACAGDASIF